MTLRSKKRNTTTGLLAKTVGQTIMEITIICIKGEGGREGFKGETSILLTEMAGGTWSFRNIIGNFWPGKNPPETYPFKTPAPFSTRRRFEHEKEAFAAVTKIAGNRI